MLFGDVHPKPLEVNRRLNSSSCNWNIDRSQIILPLASALSRFPLTSMCHKHSNTFSLGAKLQSTWEMSSRIKLNTELRWFMTWVDPKFSESNLQVRNSGGMCNYCKGSKSPLTLGSWAPDSTGGRLILNWDPLHSAGSTSTEAWQPLCHVLGMPFVQVKDV